MHQREILAQDARIDAERIEAAQVSIDTSWLSDVLRTKAGGFAGNMVRELERSNDTPIRDRFTDRQFTIIRDIFCKNAGRAGSTKYDDAADLFDSRV